MTEEEAKALASELDNDPYWFVTSVEPWSHGAEGEWAVYIIHRLNPGMIYVHPGCFTGEHRNHDYRSEPRPGERRISLGDA